MFKKIISVMLCAAIIGMPCTAAYADEEICDSAASSVIMSADGQVLYGKNADARSLVASTTKLMTALIVLEKCSGEELVPIRPEYCSIEGSSMYLKAGESYTVRELLTGMILASGNDAARALACHAAGSEEAFAAMMNEKAASLGMKNSHFMNPHGLNAEGHYSSAEDLAILMNRCMDNADFRRIACMKSAQVKDQLYYNHNKLLESCEGCIGGKTGYTLAAGRCLVSCCEREGVRLVCVTLNDPNDWEDHKNLYDWAFSKYRMYDILNNLELFVDVIGTEEERLPVTAEGNTALLCKRSSEITVECELPKFVFAPVASKTPVGEIRAYIDGVYYKKWTLYLE